MEAPPVQYVKTHDGLSIAYSVMGQGPPLIYLPLPQDNLQHLHGFQPTLYKALAKRFQLVLYDARGQGLSSRGLDSNLSLEHFCYDIDAVLARLRLERVTLYGLGLHAAIAIKYAVDHPGRVGNLFLQFVHYDPHEQLSAYMAELARNDWLSFLRIIFRSMAAPFGTRPTESEMLEFSTQTDWLTRIDNIDIFDVRSLLGRVQHPTMVRVATNYTADVLQSAQRFASEIAGAELVSFDPRDQHDRPDEIAEQLFEFVTRSRTVASANKGAISLSNREIEVLRLLAAGRTNQKIADDLVISLNTVRRHVSNLFAKTGAANRADAVSYAHRHGLISDS